MYLKLESRVDRRQKNVDENVLQRHALHVSIITAYAGGNIYKYMYVLIKIYGVLWIFIHFHLHDFYDQIY